MRKFEVCRSFQKLDFGRLDLILSAIKFDVGKVLTAIVDLERLPSHGVKSLKQFMFVSSGAFKMSQRAARPRFKF